MTIFLTGLLTCLALIVAIGAQSLFIMRQAIRRDRILLVLAVCWTGDVVLILAGTAGVGALTESAPWVIEVLRWAGVVYLLWFAYSSFRSAFISRRSLSVAAEDGGQPEDEARAQGPDEPVLVSAGGGGGLGGAPATGTMSVVSEKSKVSVRMERSASGQRTLTPVWTVVLAALSVSMLNPHAILDTVVMLGTLANNYGADKWLFAGGALTASAVWFLILGLGVRALAPLLDTPRTWRIVDVSVGVIMLFIAGTLALG